MPAPTVTTLRIVGTLSQSLQLGQDGFEESISYDIEADLSAKVIAPADLATVTADARTTSLGVGGITLPSPYSTTLAGTYGTLTCKACRLKKSVDDGTRLSWSVEFNNRSFTQAQQQQATQPNPTLRLVETWEETELIERPIREDKDGQPLLNTAGVEPLEPLMLPIPHPKLWTSVKMTSRPAFYDTLQTPRPAINSVAVTFMGVTYAPRTLWFVPSGISSIQSENGYSFREIRWCYSHAPETWPKRYKRLSVGYEFRDSTDMTSDVPPVAKLKPIKLRNGELPRAPMMLDEDGGFPENQEPTSAFYQDSNVFQLINFLTAHAGNPLPGLGVAP